MKKLILGLMVASTLAGPVLTAPAAAQRWDDRRERAYERRERAEERRERREWRQWRRGQRFDQRYAQNYRVVDYRTYRGRGLYAPPRGYRWVRSGNDAVLVAVAGGVIGAVLAGALR